MNIVMNSDNNDNSNKDMEDFEESFRTSKITRTQTPKQYFNKNNRRQIKKNKKYNNKLNDNNSDIDNDADNDVSSSSVVITSLIDEDDNNDSKTSKSLASKQPGNDNNILATFNNENNAYEVQSPIVDSTQQQQHEFLIDNSDIKEEKIEKEDLQNDEYTTILVKQEDTFKNENDQINDIKWNIGDIIWARVGKHPLWPSMIDIDPHLNTFIKIKNGKNFKQVIDLHVRFFGDCGRRSWVPASSTVIFNGKKEYDNLLNDVLSKTISTKKHRLIKKKYGFFITPKNLAAWNQAVQEAETLMSKTLPERFDFFKTIIENNLKNKIAKLMNDKSNKKLDDKSVDQSINDKSIDKSLNDNKSNVNVIADKSIDNDKLYPKTSTPKKQQARLNTDNDNNLFKRKPKQHEIIIIDDDNDADNTDADNVDDNIDNDHAADIKKHYLFNGISKDKVCEICFKGNNDKDNGMVFKCNGSCLRYFHHKCCTLQQQEFLSIDNHDNEDIESCSSYDSVQITNNKNNIQRLSIAEQIDLKMAEVMRGLCDEIKYTSPTDTSDEDDDNVDTTGSNHLEYHVTGDDNNDKLMCIDCRNNKFLCFICNKDTDKELKKCSFNNCNKYYHIGCLLEWPQTQQINTTNNYICPLHVCHTCISDDPRQQTSLIKFNNDKLAKCIKCPTSYHNISNYCLTAGAQILSCTQIICPKHLNINRKKDKRKSLTHINTSWCFICSKGGTLICCETCPTSFHIECLHLNTIPNESDQFICEECETGRLPLYHELVWVKLGNYRWWPSIIILPSQIPTNMNKNMNKCGEFVIQFMGSHDYYWVNRGRVFFYQEGDSDDILKSNTNTTNTKAINKLFIKALQEANVLYNIIREQRQQYQKAMKLKNEKYIKPPKYIKIKTNKPVGNVRLYNKDVMQTDNKDDSNDNDNSPSMYYQQSCECNTDLKQYCGPQSSCINRLLLQECNPQTCPYGTECLNQQFESRKYPELQPFKTVDLSRGWGLKTMEFIKKGQFVIEYVGELINDYEYKRRIHEQQQKQKQNKFISSNDNYYFLIIDKDRILDAGPKGNVARFMNHSCDPNCETQKWTVNGTTRVGLFALQDIEANTELTFNYNLECIDKHKTVCKCGAQSCTGFIGLKKENNNNNGTDTTNTNGNGIAGATTTSSSNHSKRNKYITSKLKNKSKYKYCFICNENKTEGRCRMKSCAKTYHLACVQLEQWPKENWYCPRHKCFECGKKHLLKSCTRCIKSYCKLHATNKFYDINLEQPQPLLCIDHPQELLQENEQDKVIKTEPEEQETILLSNTTDNINIDQPQQNIEIKQETESISSSLNVNNLSLTSSNDVNNDDNIKTRSKSLSSSPTSLDNDNNEK
ncbi:histone-lysine N-methyltransferase NSD2-like [Chrysoperla carnea]|uniref:histone-lysine N-methyltransferase NSD2-like n=1 Tax=Chrysoperla carnea TaxID=189513 RepID=UPI001D092227|nr:histone-lysine N-methyltransferase NSD2-like [Chrysoperla carnea]